jgi:hypothetical protein
VVREDRGGVSGTEGGWTKMVDTELLWRKPAMGKSARLESLSISSGSGWLLRVEGTEAVLSSNMVGDEGLEWRRLMVARHQWQKW